MICHANLFSVTFIHYFLVLCVSGGHARKREVWLVESSCDSGAQRQHKEACEWTSAHVNQHRKVHSRGALWLK